MNKMQSANNICWTVPASLTIFKNTRGKWINLKSHFLRLPGRLLKKAAAVSWNVPFSKGTFNLSPKSPKSANLFMPKKYMKTTAWREVP